VSLSISSAALADGQPIHKRYTCDGANVSPPLEWSGVPSNAQSLALIVEDPDAPDPKAPKTTWIHWILYNIPPSVHELREDVARYGLPAGVLEGVNDWTRTGYGGPCPPVGSHRYFHRLYALSALLPDLHGPRKSTLLQAMRGKVLAEAALMGVYARRASR
jgi:Raf kinase inhibitor-like YbhB/YbcL family protein